MKVAITGASGLVGRALVEALTARGDRVLRLVRHRTEADGELAWDPAAGQIDLSDRSLDAVVHLAGENIAEGRWTEAKMERIRASRVRGTQLLCDHLAQLGVERGPKVLVAASAIGYYGDRGEEQLTERSKPGEGFLPEVCAAWERATEPAREAGLRVVNLRIGVVLSPSGGALAKMLPPFKLGVGGRLGPGDQYMAWITREDLVRSILHSLDDARLSGPINAVAPAPVTNLEFTKALGRVLHRPTIFPVPAAGARIAFGKMADALLLSSARVLPGALTEGGFRFLHPDIARGLEAAVREN